MTLGLYAVVVLGGCVAGSAWSREPNSLTQEEKQVGFELLFNGQDLDGWGPVEEPWKVQDGAIFLPEAPSSHGLHFLAYQVQWIPADFELRFEWKEVPPGDPHLEGQFAIGTYHGQTTKAEWTGCLCCSYYAGGRHVKLITNEVTVPARWTGFSTSLAPGKDARRPAGQWNASRMLCKGSTFQHWLNGQKILELDLRRGHWMRDQESGSPLLDQWLKVKTQGFRLVFDGLGGAAWYRSIKVRAIPKDEEIVVGE